MPVIVLDVAPLKINVPALPGLVDAEAVGGAFPIAPLRVSVLLGLAPMTKVSPATASVLRVTAPRATLLPRRLRREPAPAKPLLMLRPVACAANFMATPTGSVIPPVRSKAALPVAMVTVPGRCQGALELSAKLTSSAGVDGDVAGVAVAVCIIDGQDGCCRAPLVIPPDVPVMTELMSKSSTAGESAMLKVAPPDRLSVP